jgi:predicted Zn-dependent protease
MDAAEAWYRGEDYLKLARKYPTALSHVADTLADLYYGGAEEAVSDAGQAIASDPNDPEAHIAMAWALIISGKPTEALHFIDSATRLNPSDPGHYVLARGIALFAAGDVKGAAQVLADGIKKNPQARALLPPLASMLAQLGNREQARATLLTWRPEEDLSPNFLDTYVFPVKWPPEYAYVRERLYDGIRVASLPPNVTVPTLLDDLKQDDPFAQTIALQRLGWFGPAAAPAVPALIDLLGNEELQEQVVQTLGKIGPEAKAALPALLAMENESVMGFYVKDALKQIRGN